MAAPASAVIQRVTLRVVRIRRSLFIRSGKFIMFSRRRECKGGAEPPRMPTGMALQFKNFRD
jgi:hypothetical protein